MAKTVLQFRVTLLVVKPAIWRLIQVPSTYTFWDLHVAIQDSMGWLDYHLHQFRVIKGARSTKAVFGIPDDDPFPGMPRTLPDWEASVMAWLTTPGHRAEYWYDFGDDWKLSVELEGLLLAERGTTYPRCVDGARAGPPEDCGGPHFYDDFLAALADPRHERHADLSEWVGGSFDAEAFNPAAVRFDNPRVRWRRAFREAAD